MIPAAIFIRTYLGIPATFIYRQLKGVMPDFAPSVICRKTENLDIFPHDKIHCVPDDPWYENSAWDKIGGKIKRAISGYYNLPPKKVYDFWFDKLKSENCRLIHAHFGMEGIMMVPLARRLNIPLIVTLHGYDMSRLLLRRGYKKELVEMFDNCSLVIAVSDKFRNDALNMGCDPGKIVRHYIGVPVDEFRFTERKSVPGKPLVFLQVARFSGKKGHIYTIKAFKKVLEAGIDGKLILAGDGPLLEDCMKLSSEMGIRDMIDFPGKKPMNEIPPLLETADIFVQHSVTAEDGDTEGIPIGLMEAMASGLPVLSTFHTGIPELVVEEKSGFLVNERDVDLYARRWIETAKNPDMRASMGKFNRDRIEDSFNMKKQNEILKSLYKKVLDGEKSR